MLKLVKSLSSEEVNSFELITKSKNRPYKPIYWEELPNIMYNNSPRKLLGTSWFNNYTKDLNKVKVCQGCGKPLLNSGERHEVYGLYRSREYGYVVKLEYVMKVCSRCHKSIHTGFSTKLGLKYGYVPTPTPKSRALEVGPWDKVKYLLVERTLYEFR